MFQHQLTAKEVKTIHRMEVSTSPQSPCSISTKLSPMPTLELMPEEIVLNIFRYLDVRSIGKVGMTCQNARFLWMRLLKASYRETMLNAAKAEFKIGLRRKALLFRTRKDLGFTIHIGKETLSKIKLLEGIRLLGRPRSSKKGDGEMTESDSPVLMQRDLPFLSFEEIAILGSMRIASYIAADQLGLQEALNLTPSEFAALDNPWIYTLIGEGRLTVEQAIKLTDKQFCMLGQKKMYGLINQGVLEIQEALDFDDVMWNTICTDKICLLLQSRKITFSKIKSLSFKGLELLNRRSICGLIMQDKLSSDEVEWLECDELRNLDSGSIFNLITVNKLSIDQAKRLSQEERRRLNKTSIHNLIFANKLNIDDVTGLCDVEFNNLDSEWIARLILADVLNIDDVKHLSRMSSEGRANEFRNLDNKWIYQLIEKRILSVDQAKGLHAREFDRLNSNWIYDLIVANKISIDDAKRLDHVKFEKLNKEWISRMVCEGILKLSEAKCLSYQEIDNLDNEGIYHLIRANRLRPGNIRWNDSKKRLTEYNNIGIDRLIRNKWLPLRNPECLTGFRRRLLKSTWIHKLLLDGESGMLSFYLNDIEKLKTEPYRARMMRQSEWDNLNSKWIYTMILREKIMIRDAKRLPRNLFGRLSSEYGSLLVLSGALTVEEVEDFSDKEHATLSSPGVSVLIASRRLCIEDALQLSASAVHRFELNLREKGMGPDIWENKGEDAVYKHLSEIEDKASTNGEFDSTGEEFTKRYEDSPWIRALVENPNIEFSREDAKKLYREPKARFRQSAWDNLNNKQIYDLIADGYDRADGDRTKWVAAGKLTIAAAKKLPRGLFDKLNSKHIVRLICKNALSVESVRDLSVQQCRRLNTDGIARLIIGYTNEGGCISVKDIVELSEKGFVRACHPPLQQLLSDCLLEPRDLDSLADNEF